MFFSRPAGHKYVDRGDPETIDFDINSFVLDGGYHDLDLSAIIPINTQLVLLRLVQQAALVGKGIYFRKKGYTNSVNEDGKRSQVADVYLRDNLYVTPNAAGIIEYWTNLVITDVLEVTVAGWWV